MTGTVDRLAVLAAVCLAVVATGLGLTTGYHTVDVDEVVFRRTVVAMQDGQGYYPAMRDALVAKEGAPPSQIRSVRPPTLYLFLAHYPERSWRYIVGGVYLAVLLLAWRLARSLHPYGGPIAVVLAGMWVLGAAPLLHLHTELWGLPLLLAGALAMRNRRWALAAVALALAALLREIYVLPLVLGLAVAPRRRAFVAAVIVVAGLAILHASEASRILSAVGREAAFGKSGLGPHYILSALSPSDRVAGWLVGVPAGVLGFIALRARWAEDAGARVLLPFAVVMVPLTVVIGREYWGLAFGPALACYAPAALAALSARSARYRPRTDARNLPV